MTKPDSTISRIPVDLPSAEKSEFTQIAREKYDRGAGPMVRQLIRDFIARERAAQDGSGKRGKVA